MADKRWILRKYRGVHIKVQVHSTQEEVEFRDWAKIKSFGVLTGGLVGLWCKANLYCLYPSGSDVCFCF